MEHLTRQGTDGKGMKRAVIFAIAMALIMVVLAPRSQAQGQGEARSDLRNLSNAFTQVAQDAMPAVVFIQVENILQGGEQGANFNNPFDLFGEEFFERFFGQ